MPAGAQAPLAAVRHALAAPRAMRHVGGRVVPPGLPAGGRAQAGWLARTSDQDVWVRCVGSLAPMIQSIWAACRAPCDCSGCRASGPATGKAATIPPMVFYWTQSPLRIVRLSTVTCKHAVWRVALMSRPRRCETAPFTRRCCPHASCTTPRPPPHAPPSRGTCCRTGTPPGKGQQVGAGSAGVGMRCCGLGCRRLATRGGSAQHRQPGREGGWVRCAWRRWALSGLYGNASYLRGHVLSWTIGSQPTTGVKWRALLSNLRPARLSAISATCLIR